MGPEGGLEHAGRAAPAVSEQPDAAHRRDLHFTERTGGETVQYRLQVAQLAAEGVRGEAVELVELEQTLPDAGSREVEADHQAAGADGQLLAQVGEEPPVLEALEAVALSHDDQCVKFLEGCGDNPPGKIIREACRVAVAHASPTRGLARASDSDDAEEVRRLHTAVDVMRLLARHFIATEFSISDSIYSGD